jgi:hypothetical protein
VQVPAVDLHDEPLGGPQKINGEGSNSGVDPGFRQAVAAAECEEPRLELAASVVCLPGLLNRKPEEFRLAQSRSELRLGKEAAEITERP